MQNSTSVYLDYNATTPVHPLVLDAMSMNLREVFGNSSSRIHAEGWKAQECIEIATEQVANAIAASPSEIVFTSGATESLNLAIQGLARTYFEKGKHLVSLKTEHKAVLECLDYLASTGFEVTLLDVDEQGFPDINDVESSIRKDTIAFIAMLANNETGRVLPIRSYSDIVHEKGAFMVCDASQAMGKIEVNVQDLHVDILAISAHKFYGPKGIGALYLRRRNPRVTIQPLIFGGGQQRGIRPGTLPTHQIVGIGKAAEWITENLMSNQLLLLKNKELLENRLLTIPASRLVVSDENRLPNTTSLYLEGIRASELFSKVPELCFSAGSACNSALPKASHVLLAMGYSEEQAWSCIRLSHGIFTQAQEIELAIQLLKRAVLKMRA